MRGITNHPYKDNLLFCMPEQGTGSSCVRIVLVKLNLRIAGMLKDITTNSDGRILKTSIAEQKLLVKYAENFICSRTKHALDKCPEVLPCQSRETSLVLNGQIWLDNIFDKESSC
jgi:hypothetical protein